MKCLVFRVRKRYFDAIKDESKKIEFRKDTDFWRKRIFNLVKGDSRQMLDFLSTNPYWRPNFRENDHDFKEPIVGVFLCGKRVHRRRIVKIERLFTPSTFSEQGKKDVPTPYCWGCCLGEKQD